MQTLDYPIRVPSDVLEALGKFTGHFWSDSLSLEPFICEATRSYVRPAPAAQTQPASAWQRRMAAGRCLPLGAESGDITLLGNGARAEPPPQERERRAAERRTASREANGKRTRNLHQAAVHERDQRQGGTRQREPGAADATLALLAMNSNGSQRKDVTGRDGHRKRRAKHHAHGKP